MQAQPRLASLKHSAHFAFFKPRGAILGVYGRSDAANAMAALLASERGALARGFDLMAELKRNVIRERVVAGLDYARTHGTKTGRGLGRPKVIFDREAVRRMRDSEGLSWRQIAARLNVGVG